MIGRTGRNWPIQDGKDHIKLINSCVKTVGSSPAGAGSNSNVDDQGPRSRGDSTNITRDPHATLSLFAPREKNDQGALPAVVAPRASAKPPPREYSELFVGGYTGDDAPTSPSKASAREPSESPPRLAPSKVGAGKNYSPSRIFDPEEHPSAAPLSRTNPKKYQHFDFGDGSEEPEDTPRQLPLKAVKASRHGSQWGFDDFNTPAKVVPTKALRNTNDVRHWGTSDDEVIDSPIKAKKVDKPRKTLEPNFEFVDDGTPEGERRLPGRPRGAGQNTGLGLYKNNLYDDENGGSIGEEAKQQVTISNVKDRRKDFDPHFAMADDSPSGTPLAKKFESGDKEPVVKADEAASKKQKAEGINIAGDGMGGRKGSGRQWGFGDDSGGEEAGGISKPSKYKTGKSLGKGQGPGGDFWDF